MEPAQLTVVVDLHRAVPASKLGGSFPILRGHGLKSILRNSISTTVTATKLTRKHSAFKLN